MKTKKEAFPDFQRDYQDYLLDLERQKNAEIKEEKMKKLEEEKSAKEAKKAQKKEWDDFFDAQEETGDMHYAGGDNTHLDDDFM